MINKCGITERMRLELYYLLCVILKISIPHQLGYKEAKLEYDPNQPNRV
jgi:hypothetical protein